MTKPIKRYAGWWEVPEHLVTATTLGQLEFPRTAPDQPTAWVETRDWRDKKDTVALYDARKAVPTKATAAQLEAAAARSTNPRTCPDCGAHTQRPLVDVKLCPACARIGRLRAAQQRAAVDRAAAATTVAQLLARPDLAVVQVDLTVPPPTPSGRARPATAAHVRAVDDSGKKLLDVLVRLVGPRAQHVPAGAVPLADAVPTIHAALIGRALVAWNEQELYTLRQHAPHPTWSAWRYGDRPTGVATLSARWHGLINPDTRNLISPIPPGTPDRLLLHLRRIAATAPDGSSE